MSNPFPIKNHSISLQQATEMTTRYRENKNNILSAGVSSDTLAICETFSKESVEKLLSVSEAVSFRIYYGMDVDLKIHAILVAADAEGKDMLPSSITMSEDEPLILEDASRCPPYCPPPSELNS